jgi:hypothetical protein
VLRCTCVDYMSAQESLVSPAMVCVPVQSVSLGWYRLWPREFNDSYHIGLSNLYNNLYGIRGSDGGEDADVFILGSNVEWSFR